MKVEIYKDFITNEEQSELVSWAKQCFRNQELISNGKHRYFQKFSKLPFVHETAYVIKQRVIKLIEKEYILDTVFEDFLSFNFLNASIDPHTDINVTDHIHTRYNLLISLPESGGLPIYNGELLNIEEKTLWKCEAGKYKHASTTVIGKKPRINISFGFQIK